MTLVSVALLIVLWSSRRDPLLVVWLLCLGSFFWTSFLTETMSRSTVFHYDSYGLLLASAAHSALNPEIGEPQLAPRRRRAGLRARRAGRARRPDPRRRQGEQEAALPRIHRRGRPRRARAGTRRRRGVAGVARGGAGRVRARVVLPRRARLRACAGNRRRGHVPAAWGARQFRPVWQS